MKIVAFSLQSQVPDSQFVTSSCKNIVYIVIMWHHTAKAFVNIVVLRIGVAKPLEILLFCDIELQNAYKCNGFVMPSCKMLVIIVVL